MLPLFSAENSKLEDTRELPLLADSGSLLTIIYSRKAVIRDYLLAAA